MTNASSIKCSIANSFCRATLFIPLRCFSTINDNITDKDLLGSFFIILSNISSNPTSYFFYLDHKTHQIINYKEYKGKSFYKEFGQFILYSLLDISKTYNVENKDMYVLVPKAYNNIIKSNKFLNLTNINTKSYN
jgi:hypothetical protein